MKNHLKHIHYLAILSLIFVLTACKKKEINVTGGSWNPDFAAPIGEGEFRLDDILNSKKLSAISFNTALGGEISIAYHAEVGDLGATNLVELNDYSKQVNLLTSDLGLVPLPFFNSTVSSSSTEIINFPITAGTQLNDVNLLSGTLDITVNTALKHNVTLTINFLDIYSNGSPVTKVINLNYGGSVPQIATTQVNLANDRLDFTSNGTQTNAIRVQIDATISGTGNSIVGNENFDMNIDMSNLQFKNATGYFGQQTIASTTDTLLMKLFKTKNTGEFTLTNPKINFSVLNSFGIPCQVNITNLQSIDEENGTTYNLVNNTLSNIDVSAPQNIGDSALTKLPELNNTNTTNIEKLTSSRPQKLTYTIGAVSNPQGQTGTLNFIDANSKMKIMADLELPLEGFASNFQITDTIPFKLNQSPDMLESAMIRFNSTNGFPISFATQATFVDENYTPVFELFTNSTEELLVAAPVNSSGIVTSTVNKVSDINLTADKLSKLGKVKYIIVTGEVATTQPQNTIIKILDNYKLAFNLGIKVTLNKDL